MAAMPRQSSRGVNEPVLEGLAMAGLVAILRNLGDLAELAAEVLDGLQDQVGAVSARARRLTARAKQLQADLDQNGHRRRLLCQALTTRTPTQRQQCLNQVSSRGVVSVAGGEARPRSIVNHIKRCRGPPRLSALDRFDAHGDGACLKRYTNPSFFRENACSANHLHQADSDHTKSRTDDSENKSLGLLSMLRRQTAKKSVSCPSLKPQTWRHKSSAGRSADHSGTDVSFDDVETDKANANHPSTSTAGQSKDAAAAASDCVGSCSDLQRTSSFEAWLSPAARFSAHVVESSPRADDTMQAKQDYSAAAETSCSSTVSSLPLLPTTYRKPFREDQVQRAIHSHEGRSEHTDRPKSSATGQGDENVFFSALEQLARPKRPLPEVASCDRITLRNGPSPLHASRSILEQIKGKYKDGQPEASFWNELSCECGDGQPYQHSASGSRGQQPR